MPDINTTPPPIFQASYAYGPKEQQVKLPHPITAFFNSIIVHLFKVWLFPGASIIKGRTIDAKRIAESEEKLKSLGAESVTIKTADGDKLSCIYIEAEKFKKNIEKYLEKDSYTNSSGKIIAFFRVKPEYCKEQKIVNGTVLYQEPLPEAAKFLNNIKGVFGVHKPLQMTKDSQRREYIIEIDDSPVENNSSSSTALIAHASGIPSIAYKGLAGEYLLHGINVMMVDLRGYGKSEGSPTDFRTNLDLDAAYQYLQKEKGVKNEELLLHAHCISGGPATDLAARRHGVNILLDRTFADFKDVAAVTASKSNLISRIVRFIMPYIVNYNSAKNLSKIQGHIAIAMDTHDAVIPEQQITKLIQHLPYRKGQRIKLMDSNVGHSSLWANREATKKQFDQFLQQIHFGRKLF